MVDSSNLVSYIQAVVDATLGSGIEAQMQAFRDGFNEVSPPSADSPVSAGGWAARVPAFPCRTRDSKGATVPRCCDESHSMPVYNEVHDPRLAFRLCAAASL